MSETSMNKGAKDVSFDVVVRTYMFAAFMLSSGIISIFPYHVFETLVKGVIMACIGCAIVYCYINRYYIPACIAAFPLIYGIVVQMQFVLIANVSPNFNAGYEIYAFGGIAIMYVALRDDPNRICRMLFQYALFYVVFLFLVSWTPILKDIVAATPLVGHGHGDNQNRVHMTFLFPIMTAALCLEGVLQRKTNATMLVLLLMSLVCIIFSDFRVGTALSLAVLFSYVSMRLLSFQMKTIAWVFSIGTAAALSLLAACYVLNLNPYLLAFHDTSTFTRALGFYTIRGVMMVNPVFGMGIGPGDTDFNWANRSNFQFYDSDYGIFGILVWGGLFAEVLYLAVIFTASRFSGDARRIGVNQQYIGAMALTGFFQLAYNISSPTNMFAGYKEYGCLMVAAALLAFERKWLGGSPQPSQQSRVAIA